MIRVWFFGTPSLSERVLADCIQSEYIDVCYVVTNPDKPVGRSATLTPSPVKVTAEKHSLPVFTPQKIRGNEELFMTLRSYEVDYLVVVAYGKILPKEILELPKKLPINIHGSILPKYRGASPIQECLLQWETVTGVTIMEMSEWMDEGDILSITPIAIDSDETSGTLFEKFAGVSGKALIDTLRLYESGNITKEAQDNNNATYCSKIEKEHGLIPWTSKTAKEIYHMWQGYNPWPGIYAFYQEKRILIEKCHYSLDTIGSTPIGSVVKKDGKIGVQCTEGILFLETVKPEWKWSQEIATFVNGHKDFLNHIFP